MFFASERPIRLRPPTKEDELRDGSRSAALKRYFLPLDAENAPEGKCLEALSEKRRFLRDWRAVTAASCWRAQSSCSLANQLVHFDSCPAHALSSGRLHSKMQAGGILACGPESLEQNGRRPACVPPSTTVPYSSQHGL